MARHFTGILLLGLFIACTGSSENSEASATWGERLGYAKDKRVLILHADDIGMCYEANVAAKDYLIGDFIQSASAMVPCPWFDEIADWYRENSEEDVGLHLALTSEWDYYRWGSVSRATDVPGLIDPDGYLWREVIDVVKHASGTEVEKEIRAQVERSISRGIRPGHLDTHMGTLYASTAFTEAYFKVATEYGIPAMVIEFTPEVVVRFRGEGYPIDERMIELGRNYPLPKLDDFYAAPEADTYAEKKGKFYKLVQSLKPGITEIIFHPSIETPALKRITNSWQQRVWEAQMFSDPEVMEFLQQEGVLFTNWKEMMGRFRDGPQAEQPRADTGAPDGG
ncbi:MAG: polysaccharide deacetylase family protein [Candidatus Marinimicrobia bacterium]|nr:polysaccharide deacetylase family protein [Candidatus Neomarinimicrobiota bacterium]